MNFPATDSLAETFSVLDNLTATERERLRDCRVAFEVSLGVIYGDRLATIMVESLIDDLALDPRIFRYVVSGDTSEVNPENRAAFKSLAREQVEANELAVRNLQFSDQARKSKLAKQYLEALKPAQRIAYERDGTLADRTAQYVQQKLDERVEG